MKKCLGKSQYCKTARQDNLKTNKRLQACRPKKDM